MRNMLLVACAVFAGAVLADDLKCENKVAAIYSPGANWNQLNAVLPSHLGFITNHINSGEMNEGGPFFDKDGATGGFMVYNSEDIAAVEAIVKQDPFIANGVAEYKLRTWMKCTK